MLLRKIKWKKASVDRSKYPHTVRARASGLNLPLGVAGLDGFPIFPQIELDNEGIILMSFMYSIGNNTGVGGCV